ncbi:MAG TPA: cation transporter [Acidimicrobiia bacterium]|jgi:copper chaperone
MTTLTLSVPDISCGHCKTAIEGAVSEVAGVEQVEVTIESKTVDVVLDPATPRHAIVTAIESQGYEVAPS